MKGIITYQSIKTGKYYKFKTSSKYLFDRELKGLRKSKSVKVIETYEEWI